MTSEPTILRIDGHQLAALCLNPGAAGEPVILLHGITSSIFAWLGLYQKLVRGGAPGRAVYKAIYKLAGLSPALLKAAMRIYVADARAFYAYPDLPDMMRRAYPAFKQLDLEAMIHYFSRMPEIDISDWLPRITASLLALTGDCDPIVPPTQAQQIASLVKGAELAVIAGAGHLPFAERASEYNSVLSRWLAH